MQKPPTLSDAGKPLPHCKAFLLCENIAEHEVTGAISLVNLIEVVRLREFPGFWGPYVLFLQLYDGIGRYSVSVELRDLAKDRIARAALHEVDFPNRLDKMDIAIPVETMRLPRPGRFEWVVLIDGQALATQYFEAEIEDD